MLPGNYSQHYYYDEFINNNLGDLLSIAVRFYSRILNWSSIVFYYLTGQPEANFLELSKKHNGLLFTAAEIQAFADYAKEINFPFDPSSFTAVQV